MSAPLTVCCFLWADPKYRFAGRYGAEHVNRLHRMVARNLAQPHRFVCVTDIPEGIERGVDIVPIWQDHRDMGGNWLRIKLFAPEMADLLGPRFVLMDLDCVVTGPLDPLFDTDADFIVTRSTNPASTYNSGFFMLKSGSRAQVWQTFEPKAARASEKAPGMWEQAWISHVLGPNEATWGKAEGVLQYNTDVLRGNDGKLPDGARIVFFPGPYDPSLPKDQAASPWIKEFWF